MTDISDAPKARADRRDKSIAAAPNFDLLAGVSLRVSVEVGSTSMTLSELLAIDEGSVIELDRAATDLLDIYANGTLIAKGEIVSVDGRYGIQVAEVVAPARGLEGFERERLMFEYILRLLILLPLVGGMAWGSLWLWKRVQMGVPLVGGGTKTRAVEMIDMLPLGPGSKLAVVEFAGQRVLIAVSRNGITRIADDSQGDFHAD